MTTQALTAPNPLAQGLQPAQNQAIAREPDAARSPSLREMAGKFLRDFSIDQHAKELAEFLLVAAALGLEQKAKHLVYEYAKAIEEVDSAFVYWSSNPRKMSIVMAGTTRKGSTYKRVARAIVSIQKTMSDEAVEIEGGYIPEELPGEGSSVVFVRH